MISAMGALTRDLVGSVFVLLATCACGSSRSPAGPTGQPGQLSPHIVVLGDSLAVSPSRDQSFPAVLQTRVAQRGQGWVVVNASESGDTTAEGLARLDPLLRDDVRIIVVALGANDGLRGVSIAMVEQNLSAIVERAQSRGIRVLLCGMETPPLHGLEYTIAFHQLFPRLATKFHVPLVPFLLDGVALVPALNGQDGFHPNAAGARRIAETVWPYLEPLLQETTTRLLLDPNGWWPAAATRAEATASATSNVVTGVSAAGASSKCQVGDDGDERQQRESCSSHQAGVRDVSRALRFDASDGSHRRDEYREAKPREPVHDGRQHTPHRAVVDAVVYQTRTRLSDTV
jgi:acyl-CoA thioesterase-1